jgi:hypothetical protein
MADYTFAHEGGGSAIGSAISGSIGTALSGNVGSAVSGSIGSALSGNVGTIVTGDPSKPLATTVSGEMKITPAPMDMDINMTGDMNKPIGSRLTGDPKYPIASTVELLNIPRLTLNEIKDVLTPKIRMHIPNYQQMSFKVLGVELYSWCMSGETQVITQPFVPNRFEECRIECPDEDKRSFPDKTPTHGRPATTTNPEKRS